ncbi:MAG: ABC transporter ATP-binding protein [Oscillospiraceae bacterium]|nr:ABC transporter ATP-binding protein [Oscillospiraceae bacterium]
MAFIMGVAAIQTDNLTKTYGKFRGIDSVSLDVEAGEIYGFIGPNGAGKSTTIRTMLALIRPTSGTARIFGKDCGEDAAEIAKTVGYVPSEPSYYENMRARDFLNYAAALYGLRDSVRRINQLSERLNLELDRKISELSLGNKKKVGIISALLHNPKLLILDEPTSGLDPLMQHTFFEILKEENEKGTTIFFSSHVLSEVQKICGRVAIIKEGKVINIQSVSDLRKNTYRRVQLSALSPIPAGYFGAAGIADLKQQGISASFMYMGGAADILQKLNGLNISDILIEEPTLEEIFMHYYQ